MDLIDKKDIADLEVCQYRREVPGALQNRPRGEVNLGVHLVGNDVGQRGLTEAGGPKEERMIESFTAMAGSIDKDPKVCGQPPLPDKFMEVAGSQRLFVRSLLGLGIGNKHFVGQGLTLPHQ